jgi:hypothetical protein
MATLVERDTSGVLATQDGETEDLRTRSGKRWLLGRDAQGRRQYRVGASVGPVHYNEDVLDETGDWHEIDLDLLPVTGQGWQWECLSNGYQVRVWQRYGVLAWYAARFARAGQWVRMSPLMLCYENAAGERQEIARPVHGIAPVVDNDAHTVCWPGAFGEGLDWRYNLAPDRFFKTVTVRDDSCLPAPTIATEDLRLTVLVALSWSGQAANGFGADEDLSVLPAVEPEDAPDEQVADWQAFSVLRPEDAREALWLQEPRSWDAEGTDLPMRYELRRYGARVIGAFSVAVADLAGAAWPVSVDTAIAEEQVGAGTDDANEAEQPYGEQLVGSVSLNGESLRIGLYASRWFLGGMRFTTIPLDSGVTIDSASMSLCSSGTYSTALGCTIYSEASADPGTFNITTHTPWDALSSVGTATAAWSMPSTTGGVWYATPDLAALVQERVDYGGWASNQALVFLLRTASGSETGYRTIRAYELNASYAPKFNCTYTEAGGEVLDVAGAAVGAFTAQSSLLVDHVLVGNAAANFLAQALLRVDHVLAGTTTGTLSATGAITVVGGISYPVLLMMMERPR